VFFKSTERNRINIKVASYLKFPYACKISNTFEEYTRVSYRSGISSILPFREAVCDGLLYRTYFRAINNDILYYNNIFGEGDPRTYDRNKHSLFWLIKDIARDIYHPVEFSELNYFTRVNKSLLFKLMDKFYIISNELYQEQSIDATYSSSYAAIIDAENEKALYLENRKNKLYLNLFYPIANKIVPVAQVDNSSIKLHLVDILSQKTNTLSWGIDKMESVVMDIIYKSPIPQHIKDILKRLKFKSFDVAGLQYVEYTHDLTLKGLKYTKEIRMYFVIDVDASEEIRCILDDLGLVIVLERDGLECYLDFERIRITLSNKKTGGSFYSLENNHYKNIKIFKQKVPVSPEIPEIYLCNVLYSNKCYDIIYSIDNGIAITDKRSYTHRTINTRMDTVWADDYQFSNFAIYRHKNYLFIIKVAYKISPAYLIVIDLKSDMLYPFISKGDFRSILKEHLNYSFYYSPTNDSLVFLSTELDHIFNIKLRELNDKICQITQNECGEEHYGSVEDFVEIFDIAELLSDAILRWHKIKIKAVKALSYYIDKTLDKLYIIGKYDINNMKYIGIFECITPEDRLFIKLVNYHSYDFVLFSKSKGISHINMCNLNIQGIFAPNTLNNRLEIICNRNATFIDIWDNRISTKILQWSHTPEKITCENLGDYISVELDPWDGAQRNKRELLVLSSLNLVREMPVLIL
jgi:hypothetical protein